MCTSLGNFDPHIFQKKLVAMSHDMRARQKRFHRNKRQHGVGQNPHRRRDEFSLRERFLCQVACFQVLFLGWSIGSVHPWAQYVNLGLALTGFCGLFLPDRHTLRWDSRKMGFRLLPISPVFWLGLMFCVYVGVQCFNFSWSYEETLTEVWHKDASAPSGFDSEMVEGWKIEGQDHVAWLPSGVKSPFFKQGSFKDLKHVNPARVLLMAVPVWLWACVLTVGLQRRHALRLILWTAALGGSLMAFLGIVQSLTKAKGILWIIPSSNGAFFGTFIYPNHAAAFLCLTLSVTLALAFYHHRRSTRKLLRSGPHYILVFLGLIVFLGLVISGSRAGMVLGGAVLAFGVCTALVRIIGGGDDFRQGITLGILGAISLGFGMYAVVNFSNLTEIFSDFETLEKGAGSPDIAQRLQVHGATWDSFKDNKVFGTGAGSFRYFFPFSQQKHPELQDLYFEHAHNDYLQSLMEYGIVGFLPLFFFFLFLFGKALLAAVVRPAVNLSLLAGILAFCMHAWVDFPAQSPSVLLLAVFILAIINRWGAIDVMKHRIGDGSSAS